MKLKVMSYMDAVAVDAGPQVFRCSPFTGEHHPDRSGLVQCRAVDAYREAEDAGVDLVLAYMDGDRAVAHQFDLSKYLYEQKKKDKRGRRAQSKVSKPKTVKMSSAIADNDFLVKADQIRRFLDKGHNVQVVFWISERDRTGGETTRGLKSRIRGLFPGFRFRDDNRKVLWIEQDS